MFHIFARCIWLVALVWCSAFSGAAMAEAAYNPYEPLAVTYDQTLAADADLKALIGRLHLAIAQKKLGGIDEALSPNFVVIECDTDPTKACTRDTKGALRSIHTLPASARLRQALCCRDIAPAKITKALREETVLGLIGAALEEETAGAHPLIKDSVCLPAWPIFDAAKAAQMAEAANIEREHLRVTTQEMLLRAMPAANAPELLKLPAGQMVPLVTDLAESLPDGWTAIAVPQGGLGYTDQLGLNEIAPGGLCFRRDSEGQWRIILSILRRS